MSAVKGRIVVGQAEPRPVRKMREQYHKENRRALVTLVAIAVMVGTYLCGMRDAKYCEGSMAQQPQACRIVENGNK